MVNQVEIHLGRLECFYDGTIDQCMAEGITPLAWSLPLGGGDLGDGGMVPDNHPRRQGLIAMQNMMDEIGWWIGVSRTSIALVRLLKHPSRIIPIIGSTNPGGARKRRPPNRLSCQREDWYGLLVAARRNAFP